MNARAATALLLSACHTSTPSLCRDEHDPGVCGRRCSQGQAADTGTQTHFWAVRDYLAPVLRESKFKEHGRITPGAYTAGERAGLGWAGLGRGLTLHLTSSDEFVAAGDFLAYKFPTWTWSPASSTDAKYTREFLPPSKQYLVSRGVPCLRRVSQMESAALGKGVEGKATAEASSTDERLLNFDEGHFGEEVKGKGGEEDWLATHLDGEH